MTYPICHAGARLVVTWLAIAMAGIGGAAQAATPGEIDAARNKGLKSLFLAQAGDGGWKSAPGLDVVATSSALEALGNAGLKGPAYTRAVAWLLNARAVSTDSLSRQIVALKGAGANVTPLLDKLLTWKNSPTEATWGSYGRYSTSFPDTPLALSAIRVGLYAFTDQANQTLRATCQTLLAQKSDGSWSYTKGMVNAPVVASSASILPTSITALELEATRVAQGWSGVNCSGTIFTLTTQIGLAATWLIGKRNVDGGFGDSGTSSVMETVLAYSALKVLRPADLATTGALDYLIARQRTDGSWNGDPLQTAYVMKLLPPPAVALADADADGVPDAVEMLMGPNSTVVNSRALVPGNGQGIAGLNAPLMLAHRVVVGKPFSFTLNTAGGTPPFGNWRLVSGTLPPGLSLNAATGEITGTPTTLGAFIFLYAVTDAAAATANTYGQIDVFKSDPVLATGDVNFDTVVDLADVILAERIALGLIVPSASQAAAADVAPAGYPDGSVDAADVARIRLKALGIEDF